MLLFPTLPQSAVWLSAAPIPSLGLHPQPIEFRAALEYRFGVSLYIDERKCPYCQKETLDKLSWSRDRLSRLDSEGQIICCLLDCEQKNDSGE